MADQAKAHRHAQFSDWEKWFISILSALGVKAAVSVIITGMGLTEAPSGPGMETHRGNKAWDSLDDGTKAIMVRDAGTTSFVRVYGTWVRVRRRAFP